MSLYKSSLVLIVDANKRSWSRCSTSQNKLTFGQFIESLKRFIRAYDCMASGKDVCVIATNTTYCKIVFQGSPDSSTITSTTSSGICGRDAILDLLEESLLKFISEDLPEANPLPTLSSSLYIALCYLNRFGHRGNFSRQILLLDYSDKSMYLKQHIPLLNIAFSALKIKIPISVLALGESHSQLLEQLSDIANGTFLRLMDMFETEELDIEYAFFQTLLFWFLASNEGKNILSPPSLTHISNSAVCYCHNKTIDIGYLCSSCLTVYCTDKSIIMCKLCGCRFAKRLLKTRPVCEINLEQ